jgi:K+-transporting ATPase KdpF subunit
MDAGSSAAADSSQLHLRGGPPGASVMGAYIAAGVVALLITIYLFVALVFPEKF